MQTIILIIGYVVVVPVATPGLHVNGAVVELQVRQTGAVRAEPGGHVAVEHLLFVQPVAVAVENDPRDAGYREANRLRGGGIFVVEIVFVNKRQLTASGTPQAVLKVHLAEVAVFEEADQGSKNSKVVG